MRTGVYVLSFVAAGLVFMGAVGIAWSEELGAEVAVEVGPLKNLKGVLRCQVFTGPEGFPKEKKNAVARDDQTPKSNTVVCRFPGLKPGTYAVSVLHDEDADGEMNTNFVGIPEEGYGVSNNKLPSMSAPKFEDARFTLTAGEKKTLKVALKY
jgi:uncharacterized protein (DUF2141 family)